MFMMNLIHFGFIFCIVFQDFPMDAIRSDAGITSQDFWSEVKK